MDKTINKGMKTWLIIAAFLVVAGCASTYEKQVSTVNERVVEECGSGLFKIKANPSREYNYDYYLSIPHEFGPSSIHRLLVSPTNSGTGQDDISYHDKATYEDMTTGWKSQIARKLGVPHLMPVFPRPQTEWQYYTHALNRNTMMIKSGKMARLNLQLIAMIEDARDFLSSRGIELKDQVFMTGFSACGTFSNRFTVMHPTLVRAVASGGINGQPILPTSEYGGKTLRYPIGIDDLERIASIKFDRETYLSVSQYIYMGENDRNDSTQHEDAFDRVDSELIWAVLGKEMSARWVKAQEVYGELGIPAQMVTYKGICHQITPYIIDDIVAFFRANDSEGINTITPHNN